MRRALALGVVLAAACSGGGSSPGTGACVGTLLQDWTLQSFTPAQAGATAPPSTLDLSADAPGGVGSVELGPCNYLFAIPQDVASRCSGSIALQNGSPLITLQTASCPNLTVTYQLDASGLLTLSDQYGTAVYQPPPPPPPPVNVQGTWSGPIVITFGAGAFDGTASLSLTQNSGTASGTLTVNAGALGSGTGTVSAAISGTSLTFQVTDPCNSVGMTAQGWATGTEMQFRFSGPWCGNQMAGNGTLTKQ